MGGSCRVRLSRARKTAEPKGQLRDRIPEDVVGRGELLKPEAGGVAGVAESAPSLTVPAVVPYVSGDGQDDGLPAA